MCHVLGVSKSSNYAWLGREPSPRAKQNAELLELIREIHERSSGTYGSPWVRAELRPGYGIRCSKKARGPPDASRRPAGVADLTQHMTGEGWLYLATVLDVFSRRIVGWAMDARAQTELVLDALNMAVWNRRPGEGVIHHSDHGSQYTSLAFTNRLKQAGLVGSMGTVGDALDNAPAESFNATLQTELLNRGRWPTRSSLTTAIFSFIEGFYNRKRRHSALGYLSPDDYERKIAGSHPTNEPEVAS